MGGLGLVGAYGAAGGQNALEDMIKQRLQAQAVQQQLAQQQVENQQRDRVIGQGDQRLAMEMAPKPVAPERPMNVNGRLIMPSNPSKVIADYSTPPPVKAPGRLITVNKGGKPILTPEDQAAGMEAYQKPAAENPTADLTRQLKEAQIATEQQKTQDAHDARAKGDRGVQDSAQETLDTIDQLIDPKTGQLRPAATHIVGRFRTPEAIATAPIIGGGETANAYAAFNRLKAKVVVDLLGKMKSQSKTGATGFGALSEKEGQLLANAAAQLQNSQTPDEFRTQLVHMRALTSKVLQPAGGAATPAAQTTPAARKTAVNKTTGQTLYSDDGGQSWHP